LRHSQATPRPASLSRQGWILHRRRQTEAQAEALGTSFGACGPFAQDLAKINWRGSLAFCGPTFCSLLIVGPRLQLCSRAHRQVGRDQSSRRDLAKRATASNSAALGHSSFTEQVPDCRMTWDGQAPLACRWTNPDTAHTLTGQTPCRPAPARQTGGRARRSLALRLAMFSPARSVPQQGSALLAETTPR